MHLNYQRPTGPGQAGLILEAPARGESAFSSRDNGDTALSSHFLSVDEVWLPDVHWRSATHAQIASSSIEDGWHPPSLGGLCASPPEGRPRQGSVDQREEESKSRDTLPRSVPNLGCLCRPACRAAGYRPRPALPDHRIRLTASPSGRPKVGGLVRERSRSITHVSATVRSVPPQ